MASMTKRSTYTKELTDEIANTPPEYLPMLLRIVRSYRESVTLLPAKESLRRGWKEMYAGATFPATGLWDGINQK